MKEIIDAFVDYVVIPVLVIMGMTALVALVIASF
jgi:hypothetical protein